MSVGSGRIGRMALVGVSVLAIATASCSHPRTSASPGPTTPPTLADDRWDRSLARGEAAQVDRGETILAVGGSISDPEPLARAEVLIDVAAAPDGSIVAIDGPGKRVLRVTRDGQVRVLAGSGREASTGDGGPATAADVRPAALAVGPDGTIWINDRQSLRKIDPSGVITTVMPFTGSGFPPARPLAGQAAVDVDVPSVDALAVDPQGRPLLAWVGEIFRLEADGTLTHVAGGRTPVPGKRDGSTIAAFDSIDALQSRADGSILVLDGGARVVRAISPTGTITTWGGGRPFEELPRDLAIGADGSAIVTVTEERRVYRVTPDSTSVLTAAVSLPKAISSMPDGSVIVGDQNGGLTRVGT